MQRFYENIIKDESDCWIWFGSRSDRYGQLQFDGRIRGAHVVSYTLHCGEIPRGQYVLHTCDNGFCVNPKHLFLGSQQDNMDDKVIKNRQAKGEDIGNAKLTVDKVLEIRKLLMEGSMLQYEIAKQFGVDPKLITCIKHRRIWKHVP